jgi:transposase
MILNGLGFVSAPLYMFPKFFETKACENLIGKDIKPEYLNDDKLGRTMDKLFSKGLSTIFLAIALNAMKKDYSYKTVVLVFKTILYSSFSRQAR